MQGEKVIWWFENCYFRSLIIVISMSSKIEFVWEIFLLLTHTSFDIEFKSKVLCFHFLHLLRCHQHDTISHLPNMQHSSRHQEHSEVITSNPWPVCKKGTENWQLTFKMQLTFIIYKNTTYYYCNIIIILSQQSWTNPLTFRFKHIQPLRISAFMTLYSFNFMSNTFVNILSDPGKHAFHINFWSPAM